MKNAVPNRRRSDPPAVIIGTWCALNADIATIVTGAGNAREKTCKTTVLGKKTVLETKCKVCMDTDDCQQCLYR